MMKKQFILMFLPIFILTSCVTEGDLSVSSDSQYVDMSSEAISSIAETSTEISEDSSSTNSESSSTHTHDCQVSYAWSDDHSSVTGTATCVDSGNVITETVDSTNAVTTTPTCSNKGERTYTSNSFHNPLFSVQTYVEELEKLPHQYGVNESIDEASHSCTCSVCGDIYEEEHNFEQTGFTYAYRVNQVNHQGTRTLTCSDCGYEKIEYHWEFELVI